MENAIKFKTQDRSIRYAVFSNGVWIVFRCRRDEGKPVYEEEARSS